LRNTKALACCLLVLPLIGTARKTAWKVGARALSASACHERQETLKRELRKGTDLLRDARYAEAQLQFEKTYAAALGAGCPDIAARAADLAASPQGAIPAWDMYHYRGRVRLAQGRFREALEDLRIALRLARAWRRSAPAADASRIGVEGWLEKVHAALIEAGNRLYLATRDPALIRETFEAAEENRASSLCTLIGANPAGAALPQAYWETIARLQRAEVDALRSGAAADGQAVRAARADLARIEAAVIPGADPLPAALLERTQSALGPHDALLSFQLDSSASWLWALDRQGLALYVLPPRREIEALAQPARDAIRDASPDAVPAGAALYRALFGPLAPRFRAKTRWLLALDQGCFNTDPNCSDKLVTSLFDIPFAALPESTRPRIVYVAERRVTVIVPGAGFWLDSAARWRTPPDSSLFLGVGDPIYNLADPRLPERLRPPVSWSPLSLFGYFAARPGLVLPRLVASASELNACAQAWGGASVLLEGRDAARRQIAEQLKRSPLIAHFATHVLESSGKPSYGLIALSLTGNGESQVLEPLEIARWRIHTELVVLSGCHSAAGAALNATGLLGLTRAWLAAGARTVVGSRWPTPDDDGALFSAMYSRLRSQPRRDAAGALRAAQLEMIRSAGWRSSPRYWGAYFAVGSE
jgi:CHAT domain-containing protein